MNTSPCGLSDPGYTNRKFESFERMYSIRVTNRNFDLNATHVYGWKPAVLYMSCMSQNLCLLHVSNLFIFYPFETFEFFCSCIRGREDQGRRHGFPSGGRIVGRWLTYTQNTLKIGKVTGFGPLHFRIWRGRPLLNLSLGGRVPPSPAFDAHGEDGQGRRVADGTAALV